MDDLKSYIGSEVEVAIDRPLGSKHPKHGHTYELNYGFIHGTKMPDGEELDAYVVGTDKPLEKTKGKCIAIIHRTDDDDDKLVVSVDGKDYPDQEIDKMVDFQEKYFKHIIVR